MGDAGPSVVRLDCEWPSGSASGSVRDKGECTSSPVCVPVSGCSSRGLRCVQSRLEPVDEHLSVPSTSVVASSCSSTSGVQGTRGVSCSTLANSELVPNVIGTLQDEPVSVSDESFSGSMDFEGFSDQRSGTILEPSRLGTIRNAFQSGLSPDALSLVDMAHRDSTKRQYQAIWTKFLNYLNIN